MCYKNEKVVIILESAKWLIGYIILFFNNFIDHAKVRRAKYSPEIALNYEQWIAY